MRFRERKLRKFTIEDNHLITPFNEPARELHILNKALKLHHVDILDEVCGPTAVEQPLSSISDLPDKVEADDELLVYRDNLYFDQEFFGE